MLEAIAADLGLVLDEAALRRFARYQELLIERGSRFNLTAVLDPEGIQQRHFGESLALGVVLAREGLLTGHERLIDVGSGAGLPGLALAIAWPGLRVTLLEATRKKAQFLETVARELNLSTVTVVAERAEAAAHNAELREQFDLGVARAVARLASLSELVLPFVRIGGTMAAIKGSRTGEELTEARGAIRACGGGAAHSLPLQASGDPLRVVLVPKLRLTPRRVPRRPGVPVHDPLR